MTEVKNKVLFQKTFKELYKGDTVRILVNAHLEHLYTHEKASPIKKITITVEAEEDEISTN